MRFEGLLYCCPTSDVFLEELGPRCVERGVGQRGVERGRVCVCVSMLSSVCVVRPDRSYEIYHVSHHNLPLSLPPPTLSPLPRIVSLSLSTYTRISISWSLISLPSCFDDKVYQANSAQKPGKCVLKNTCDTEQKRVCGSQFVEVGANQASWVPDMFCGYSGVCKQKLRG